MNVKKSKVMTFSAHSRKIEGIDLGINVNRGEENVLCVGFGENRVLWSRNLAFK